MIDETYKSCNGVLITGCAIDSLKTLQSESVHCCVTSPPYYQMRDYHVDGQIGLEKTPEQYIEKLVEVFSEVKRVLRKDGTLWLNIGDSYSNAGGNNRGANVSSASFVEKEVAMKKLGFGTIKREVPEGLTSKDLIGIPWMLAFALRNDGWCIRQDIIWHKRNPLPESITDRCTKAHEYIFLLSKSRKYFYDKDAVDKARNKRSVWSIGVVRSTTCEHFAVFPPRIPATCILLGTSEHGCCSECGTPYKRTGEGWTASCSCEDHKVVPCTVLDPFSGSATTADVAQRLGRRFIAIDLSYEYNIQAADRLKATARALKCSKATR